MYWEGDLDEVRIWNVSRTVSDIIGSMHRTLTPVEVSQTVAYYNFDNYKDSNNRWIVPDGSRFGHDLTLGKTLAMKGFEERMAPSVVASSAPVWGSDLSVDLVRETPKYSGKVNLSSFYNEGSLVGGGGAVVVNVTLVSLFNADAGVDVLTASGVVLTNSTVPYTFPSTSYIQLYAKSNHETGIYVDKRTTLNVTLSDGSAFQLIALVKTAPRIHSGSSGSALYCDGRSHAYAKDFTFGPMNTAPNYTIEFWAWNYLFLPIRTPSTVFSIGNSEISAPSANNWCLGQKSPFVAVESFCKGRLLVDLPSAGGYMDFYR
jgi:hypothetical protein